MGWGANVTFKIGLHVKDLPLLNTIKKNFWSRVYYAKQVKLCILCWLPKLATRKTGGKIKKIDICDLSRQFFIFSRPLLKISKAPFFTFVLQACRVKTKSKKKKRAR